MRPRSLKHKKNYRNVPLTHRRRRSRAVHDARFELLGTRSSPRGRRLTVIFIRVESIVLIHVFCLDSHLLHPFHRLVRHRTPRRSASRGRTRRRRHIARLLVLHLFLLHGRRLRAAATAARRLLTSHVERSRPPTLAHAGFSHDRARVDDHETRSSVFDTSVGCSPEMPKPIDRRARETPSSPARASMRVRLARCVYIRSSV